MEGSEKAGGATPGAPPGGNPAPAQPRAPIFTASRTVPEHAGHLIAESDRLLEKIVYRISDRLEQLLARLDELPVNEQAKLAPLLVEMLATTTDLRLTNHWTKKLEKAILEKATLLAQGRSGSHLRKLGGMAGQIQKEQKGDGRTTEQKNKARGLAKLGNLALPDEV